MSYSVVTVNVIMLLALLQDGVTSSKAYLCVQYRHLQLLFAGCIFACATLEQHLHLPPVFTRPFCAMRDLMLLARPQACPGRLQKVTGAPFSSTSGLLVSSRCMPSGRFVSSFSSGASRPDNTKSSAPVCGMADRPDDLRSVRSHGYLCSA